MPTSRPPNRTSPRRRRRARPRLAALALLAAACGGAGGGEPSTEGTPSTPASDAGSDVAPTSADAGAPTSPSAVPKPRGTFASAGGTEAAVVGHAQVLGVLARAGWSEIEPTPGAYEFQRIDGQIQLAKAKGKGFSLAILGGPSAPAWLYEAPYRVESMDIVFRANPVKVPKFWDPTLQQRLAALAGAIAAKYGDDPSLKLVYLPQMSGNGVEGHFNGNPNDTLTRQGLNEDLWVDAVLQATRAMVAALPTKPIAVELHHILGSAGAGKRIMAGIESDATLLEHVGVACWWLSGKSDYQGDLLEAFKSFRGEVYGQAIDKASNASSFQSGDFSQIFVQAKALHMRYVEPWEVDFKSGLWETAITHYNAWASAP